MNKTKRKESLIPSIDSIKICVKGDDTNGDINKIFQCIKLGQLGIDSEFIRKISTPKIFNRKDLRKTHEITLEHGMRIGASSSSAKGCLRRDKTLEQDEKTIIKTMEIGAGGLVYEIGGIMSYDYSKLSDHKNLIIFLGIINQLFNNSKKISEIHICFDLLQKFEDVIVSPGSKHTPRIKQVMNTQYFNFSKKFGVDIKKYDKSLKEELYIDTTRIELILKKRFFDKLKVQLLAVGNEQELTEMCKKIADEICSMFDGSFIGITLKNSSQLLYPDSKKIEEQLFLMVCHVLVKKITSNNNMSPFQNLNKEQKMLWKASENIERFKKYCRKKRYLTEGKFPPLARTCDDLKMSKTTVLKIQNFLKRKKTQREADRIRNKMANIESLHISECVEQTIKNFDFRDPASYGRVVSMIDTAQSLFSAYISKTLEDSLCHPLRYNQNPPSDEVASILFGRKVKNLNEQDINREVNYWQVRFQEKVMGRLKTLLAIDKNKRKIFTGRIMNPDEFI